MHATFSENIFFMSPEEAAFSKLTFEERKSNFGPRMNWTKRKIDPEASILHSQSASQSENTPVRNQLPSSYLHANQAQANPETSVSHSQSASQSDNAAMRNQLPSSYVHVDQAQATQSILPSANIIRSPQVTSLCSDVSHLKLEESLHASAIKIGVLERENEQLRMREPIEESLGDLLTELELDSLREEVERLKSLLAKGSQSVAADKELAGLRVRCGDLEAQVENLKKEKALVEQKTHANRNADLTKIRSLQEQVTHEKKMRERIVNTESALTVVTVAGDSRPAPVTIRPRTASISGPVPAFTAAPMSKPPTGFMDKTLVLPPMTPGDLGDDYIASQWKACLSEKPLRWRMILSRVPGTDVFNFGSLKVACKKIGNRTMIQLGRETMLLEAFVERMGPLEGGEGEACDSTLPAAKPDAPPKVTMKSILTSKRA